MSTCASHIRASLTHKEKEEKQIMQTIRLISIGGICIGINQALIAYFDYAFLFFIECTILIITTIYTKRRKTNENSN